MSDIGSISGHCSQFYVNMWSVESIVKVKVDKYKLKYNCSIS